MATFRERLAALPADHPGNRFYMGSTMPIASAVDQRFSTFLHIPKAHSFTGSKLPLVVLIHGTSRRAESLRDAYAQFAEDEKCAILVPFFPAGIIRRDDLHSYKLLAYKDIRFDLVLLEMIRETAEVYNISTERFILAGFSGGGQFAHRFLYLHPHRLLGVSIGAPGGVTLPDASSPWPQGVSDLGAVFGEQYAHGPNYAEMAEVKIHFLVGELDNDPGAVADPDGKTTRIHRIKQLKEALQRVGVGAACELEVVPNVGHKSAGMREETKNFIAMVLRQ